MRPALRMLSAIVVAAGVTVALAACGDDDRRSGALGRAAAADSPFGVRYTYRTRLTDKGPAHRFRGYGQAEADQHRSRVVLVGLGIRGETIVDGDDEYTGGDFAAAALVAGPSRQVRWTKLDRSKFLDAGYIDKLCGAELPAKVAGVLADSDPTVQRLGAANVGGRPVQRYRVTTTYGRVLDVLAGDDDASGCDKQDRAGELVADLWVDRHDLIRRVRLRYRVGGTSVVETRTISSYDRDVRVAVPSGPGVADVTDEILKLADSIDSE